VNHPISRPLSATVLLLGAGIAGCSSAGQGDARFPTAAEIRQIGSAPPPAKVINTPPKDVDSWDLKAPLVPSADSSPHAPANRWERLLADAAAKRQGLLWTPESMHCLAHETGLFFLAQEATPTEELTRFMAARCGVPDGEISLAYLTGDAPVAATDDQLFGSSGSSAEQLISKNLGGGSQIAGIWTGRDKGKMVVMLPYAPRRVRLDRVPVSPSSSHVVISGELLTPAEHVEALANYGKFGFRTCAVDIKIRLPRFSVDCETLADDPAVAIEVAAFPPGRIIGRIIASLIVWPEGRVPSQYQRPSYGELPPVALGASFATGLASALNQVRKEAGLAPIVLNAEQSATATQVAPHFFAAMTGAAPEALADKIVLGLRAGWQIPGLVGYGHFTSSLTRTANNAVTLLTSILNRPSGRQTLLDPDARFLAIGPVIARDEGVLAGVFSSYTLLEPTATKKEVAAVVALLNDKRKARGLGPATLVDALQPAAAGTARSVEVGERSPEDAVDDLLQKSAPSFGQVQGWFMAADKFEHLAFPDPLLTARSPRIAVGVAHYKPKGSPWGAYGVLIVSPTASQMVAASSRARSF
jgi:uncharacterized protein YkwD